jgi:hypothetical protein
VNPQQERRQRIKRQVKPSWESYATF